MKIKSMPNTFYIENRKKLLSRIDNFSTAVFFAGNAPHKSGDDFYPFSPNRNFLYLTGLDAPQIIYMACKAYGNFDEILFVERPNEESAKWIGKALSSSEARKKSGIENIYFLDEFEKMFAAVVNKAKSENIYLDFENRFGNSMQKEVQYFTDLIKKTFPAINLKDSSKIVYEARGRKTNDEILQIKAAIEYTNLAINHIYDSAAPGMYENQIESCFDFALKYNGIKDKAFDTVVSSGKNATILHYSNNDRKIEDGDLVLVDFGATSNYYCADIARTFPINGKFTERQKEIYETVLEAQRVVIKAVRPGITMNELNNILIEYYETALKKLGLINPKARGKDLRHQVRKYYWHGVSHSLGLDSHDPMPTKDLPLEEGMVITVEPGLYIEKEKIGIRIEDDILVTKTGSINLSEAILKTVEEIEGVLSANGKEN